MKRSNNYIRLIPFAMAVLLQIVALWLMATDSAESGFGTQTLWVAPPILFVGILLPIFWLKGNLDLRGIIYWLGQNKLKLVGAGCSFVVALATYISTLEPTASLWDCAETIATAYKLQVPHTPGIPMTMLMGRLFSMLALDDVTKVAWSINLMPAVFSSLAVSVVFLIIWHFGKSLTSSKLILFFGGFLGALCLTFSDTYWFSAVEAETYGPSGFFMVLLILLSIHGSALNKTRRERRFLLLAYLSGLSYCVHPMCILILPVCFIAWKRDKGPLTLKSFLIATGLGIAVILLINKVIAVDFFEWALKLDLLLVNRWDLPLYSSVFVLQLLFVGIGIITWRRFEKLRTIILAFLLLLMGFTPYLMLFVRSAKLPPINEFSPNNLAKIKPYMNRESYPGRPLLYGPYFDAKIEKVTRKADTYIVENDKYKKVGEVSNYHYDDHRKTILPRIYSDTPAHIEVYRDWTGLSPGEVPKFSHNLLFMIKYQLGHMYFRYLMWNFSGRASDVQHSEWLLPWDGIISRAAMDYNRANNQYFLLPFLLGCLGMLWQWRKDKDGFIANLSYFLITGLLLACYLNATPNEPRERDYIYVGSYTAFAIWIGLGVICITSFLNAKWRWLLLLFLMGIPAWMFYQNLDDHDRSGRTFQIDHARNLLSSCEKNAILFTGGDNDTFPLWYLQEVEGFRTDVRVKVLSYFNADWYINQLTRPYYDSPPFELNLSSASNQYGSFHPLYIRETLKTPISWGRYLDALAAGSTQLSVKTASGLDAYFLPSRTINVQTPAGNLELHVKGSYLLKNEMAILDIIYSNNLERPVYFNFTSLNSLNIDLQPYLVQEGLVYKLVYSRTDDGQLGFSTWNSYRNLVLGADYSNLAESDVYFNHEDYQSRMILPLRFSFNTLIQKLLEEENWKKAEEVALFALNKLYHAHLEPSFADLQLASYLKEFGYVEQGNGMVYRLFDYTYIKMSKQVGKQKVPSRNDLFLLQKSVQFLNNAHVSSKYDELLGQLSQQQGY